MAETKIASLPTPQIIPASTKQVEVSYPRWFGGSASCMAVMVSHPFDLSKCFICNLASNMKSSHEFTPVKVRMQTVADGAKQGSVRTGIQIIQNEGVRGLYHGVSIRPGAI